jgi:hypothetical protein
VKSARGGEFAKLPYALVCQALDGKDNGMLSTDCFKTSDKYSYTTFILDGLTKQVWGAYRDYMRPDVRRVSFRERMSE